MDNEGSGRGWCTPRRVAPAKGTSCIAMSQKIPPRRVIGFNLGSLITFRFCARVRSREIRGCTRASTRSFAASRGAGFMPVLDNARRNAKVRKPRLTFTAKTRPSCPRDLDAAFDYPSSLWVDTRPSQRPYQRRRRGRSR